MVVRVHGVHVVPVRFWVSRQLNINKIKNMGVQKEGEKYRCNICGNEVEVKKVGGGTLVCCGEDMKLMVQGEE